MSSKKALIHVLLLYFKPLSYLKHINSHLGTFTFIHDVANDVVLYRFNFTSTAKLNLKVSTHVEESLSSVRVSDQGTEGRWFESW